jgi:hypothetical protein
VFQYYAIVPMRGLSPGKGLVAAVKADTEHPDRVHLLLEQRVPAEPDRHRRHQEGQPLGGDVAEHAIVPMRGLSPGKGLVAAVKADTLSLISWQVGMYGNSECQPNQTATAGIRKASHSAATSPSMQPLPQWSALGIVFQYYAIVPMRGLSPGKGLVAAVKADTLSQPDRHRRHQEGQPLGGDVAEHAAAAAVERALAHLGIVFQYYAIVPMRGLSPGKGLVAAVKADTLSLIQNSTVLTGADCPVSAG